MQPTLCSKCKKNVAVVFISRQNEKGEMVNEGLCLKCAAQLGLPQVEEMMKKMGISPEDLENINNEMMQAFGGAEELSDMTEAQDDDGDDDEESGKTATFPFLNRLFGSSNPPAEKSDAPSGREETPKGRKADKKHKYLDSYCINLSPGRQAGRGHRPGGGDPACGADSEPPPEEQPLPHRRTRRGQDGHCRGSGPAHCGQRRALQAAG